MPLFHTLNILLFFDQSEISDLTCTAHSPYQLERYGCRTATAHCLRAGDMLQRQARPPLYHLPPSPPSPPPSPIIAMFPPSPDASCSFSCECLPSHSAVRMKLPLRLPMPRSVSLTPVALFFISSPHLTSSLFQH